MARRNNPVPIITPKVFSDAKEIETGITKLKRRIEEVQTLDPQQIRFNDQKINNVESHIRETIRDVFGQDSPEFHDHQCHDIWSGGHAIGMSEEEYQHNFTAGIPQTISMLEGLIQHLEEKKLDLPTRAGQLRMGPASGDNVFIVHGHNSEYKESIARFVQHLDLSPIILHEKPNQGKTLIEKFEANADVGFAIVILSKDDTGGSSVEDLKPRARQNVIFELGYFVGRLGRSRVCAIYEDGVDLPSDIMGVAYVPWDASGGWKVQLIRELKAAGYQVDANKAFT